MKQKLILLAIVIAVVVGLLAYFQYYFQYVPFWATIVSTGAFLFGVLMGWFAKVWYDKHIK